MGHFDIGILKKAVKKRNTALSDSYKRALDSAKINPSPVTLRPSAMPICSILMLIELALEQTGGRFDEFTKTFYCDVGTAIHEVVQFWMGTYNGDLYGDWHCDPKKGGCGYKPKKWSSNNICPDCEEKMEYVEVEVEYDNLKGHIDAILRIAKNKFILGDFKTSSTDKIKTGKYLPSSKYLIQLSTYAAILKEDYGLDVDSISIFYISRDNPKSFSEYNIRYTNDIHEEMLDFIDQQLDANDAAIKAFKENKPRIAWKHRQCKTRDAYKALMKQTEFGGCPVENLCINCPDDERIVHFMQHQLNTAYDKMGE